MDYLLDLALLEVVHVDVDAIWSSRLASCPSHFWAVREMFTGAERSGNLGDHGDGSGLVGEL